MKVKTLLKEIQQNIEKYPDFLEWEVFTEQPDLVVPENFKTIEETRKEMCQESLKYEIPFNIEYYNDLLNSSNKIKELEESGWKFLTTSDGWVYRSTANIDIKNDDGTIEEVGFFTLFDKDKVFGISNNY